VPSSASLGAERPVVEAVPAGADRPAWLDPQAAPRTRQGEVRARYLPLWTPDFDAAFPPAVCGSAWHLDAIAVPVQGIDISAYGDVAHMGALAVMRFEHLVAHAVAAPSRLAQLCVAVAAVDPARGETLAHLAALIGAEPGAAARSGGVSTAPDRLELSGEPQQRQQDGERVAPGSSGGSGLGLGASLPRAVRLIAVGPSQALAVACASATSPAAAGGTAPMLLRAYELVTARGVEDDVVDISYRVARLSERPAADCDSLPAWAAEWEGHAEAWVAEGQVWVPSAVVVQADELCTAPSASGAADCPLDWAS